MYSALIALNDCSFSSTSVSRVHIKSFVFRPGRERINGLTPTVNSILHTVHFMQGLEHLVLTGLSTAEGVHLAKLPAGKFAAGGVTVLVTGPISISKDIDTTCISLSRLSVTPYLKNVSRLGLVSRRREIESSRRNSDDVIRHDCVARNTVPILDKLLDMRYGEVICEVLIASNIVERGGTIRGTILLRTKA